MWRHEGSRAQLLSLLNRDENKVFGVTLRTPPHDSTGLPHILEHSVLCGSKKYPLREPFVELLKGSLQTFLNAFTYPDKTCYPVASANLRDFYNLNDVYLDAVFHPRLDENVFRQEGWHLDLEAPSGKAHPAFCFKGVVYNEMKGAFSSPEALLERHALHSLFPDTPYGLESGGDPEAIPDLTFASFLAFHQRHYHPSNARFFFWGDDPEEERLRLTGDLLRGYAATDASASRVPLQTPFPAPRQVRLSYAAGAEEKAFFTLNWALPENTPDPSSVEENLGLSMLEHVLAGMPASPLRRALMESGLGEDLAGAGLQEELRQPVFSIGLRGVAAAKAPAAESLSLDTLRRLASQGVPAASAEAAINSVEFALRENNTGNFPVGLSVMLRSLALWLHSDAPESRAAIAPLRFEAPLAAIKAKADQGYFAALIRKCLLDNPHRVSLLLRPARELGRRQAEAEEARLETRLAALDEDSRAGLPEAARQLRLRQETPDPPEALALIPRLTPADLPRTNQTIAQLLPCGPDIPIYFHPQPTNGVCYLSLSLDIGAVPDRLLPLLPLLGRAMLEMGNARRGYIDLNMDIARNTGGLQSGVGILSRLSDRLPLGALHISGKATPDKAETLFSLCAELLTDTDLDKQEQVARMLLEEKARLEQRLMSAGHGVVAARLKASQSAAGCLSERLGGVSYLESVRAFCAEARSDWPGLLGALEELRRIVLNRRGLVLGLTAEEEFQERLLAPARALASALPDRPPLPADRAALAPPAREALLIPSQVNYVGKGINLYDCGYAWHGSALVILRHLRAGWLWEKIRVQGGAYGAMCGLDRATGDFFFVSYRDPNILDTLRRYDECAEHLRRSPPDRRALEAAIVGAVGELDAYLLPEGKGDAALRRKITGDTPELRARLREEVLGATARDFRRFGEALAGAMPRAAVAALGGGELESRAGEAGWIVRRLL
jgi:Zn-dependent M16 (insulinase) family peptidase